MKNDKHLYQSIHKILPVLLILFTIYIALTPETASAQSQSVSKAEADNQDFFAERFRQGRELIDRQEWARATERFREAIEKSPDNKSADAALYWMAFCYKKQKKYKEADAALARLLATFPNSTWESDARVMKTEIAPLIGRLGVLGNDKINSSVAQGQFSSVQADIVKGTVNGSVQNPSLAEKLAMTDRLPLDRADEIRIAAFQSLLTADPQRAVETTGEVFKPDSKASENLKLSVLRVWRNPRLFASQTLAASVAQNPGAKEFAALLRETLYKSFQNETNQKIRKEIIYTLVDFDDGQSTDYLKKLYASENDRETKKTIINSLGSSASVFYPFKPGQNQSADLARQPTRKIELDFLLEIVRREKDAELRQMAFSKLQRFPNWSASWQAVETMISLYDAETDEEFKILLIRALAESKQTPATRKLLDIAKNDKSDKLRLEAIYSLRTSKDPEVIKFLADLIK